MPSLALTPPRSSSTARTGSRDAITASDLRDLAVRIDEQHVERHVGIAHPHGSALRLAEVEQHAAVIIQALPEHQTLAALRRVHGHLDQEFELTVGRIDGE
jgi:hypothetical protein